MIISSKTLQTVLGLKGGICDRNKIDEEHISSAKKKKEKEKRSRNMLDGNKKTGMGGCKSNERLKGKKGQLMGNIFLKTAEPKKTYTSVPLRLRTHAGYSLEATR